MKTEIGSKVHPWYKGCHEWEVKGIARLEKPIKYDDPMQGEVSYDPKIMLLEGEKVDKVLWFTYWISTNKTKGKLKWGQGPPMLEENVLLDLMKDAVKNGLFISLCSYFVPIGTKILNGCIPHNFQGNFII